MLPSPPVEVVEIFLNEHPFDSQNILQRFCIILLRPGFLLLKLLSMFLP